MVRPRFGVGNRLIIIHVNIVPRRPLAANLRSFRRDAVTFPDPKNESRREVLIAARQSAQLLCQSAERVIAALGDSMRSVV